MTANIIDGRKIAQTTLDEVKAAIGSRLKSGLSQPGLAVILVGQDPASQVYVRKKAETCEQVGIESFVHRFDKITEADLLNLIDTLNNDPTVSGILVQLPLPAEISTRKVIEAISPHKDVDGFHPYNIGRLLQRRPLLRPCTPWGIIKMLLTIGQPLMGQHAVVVGASNIVGRPLSMEFLLAGCTVTTCHRHTKDLPHFTKQADILVSAIGKPRFIQADWIKPGATVVDVGITRLPNGKLAGDIEFDKAKEIAGWITPVPGGVGPMTVAMLMHNTLTAAEGQMQPQ